MRKATRYISVLISLLVAWSAWAQCPQILDGNGNASATPVWVHCAGTGYTLFIQTNQATGPYTIDWGDGSPLTTGASLTPPATISHTYPATLRNYNVTFTETGSGCVINGLLVLERPVNASIVRPLGSGGAVTICAPGTLGFINSSTDVSVNTTFRWNFGDGSPIVTKTYTDSGQTNNHTYQRGTVNCNTVVTLEAENYCTVTPSFATVGPINIYDIDDAAITTTNFLCYPDTVVQVLNTSNLNCRPQGNTVQRYEFWNFGNYWGTGQDSTRGWIPFANPPSVPQTLALPGKGTYTVTLMDSNMCGIDVTTATIVIGDPPAANFTPDKDTICAGERIRFTNSSTGGANESWWNFGDGTWRRRGMGNQNRTFNTPGAYTIYLAVLNTNGTASCTDTITRDIFVQPGPTADFSVNPASGCDSFLVNITENSSNAFSWSWDFGDGTTDTLANPPAHLYDSVASYTIDLVVTHANGCTDNTSRMVTVYGSPVVDFTPKNVCQGVLASFTDNSTTPGGDPLTSWNWRFGDGDSSTVQNPMHQYDSNGTYTLVLTVTTANCSSTDSFPLVVEPKPTALFLMNDSVGCSPLPISFTNNSLVSTQYAWNFGDGDTSTQTAPSHTFTNSTAATVGYQVQLVASTAFGCSDTAYDSVYVYAVPTSSFTNNAVPQCGPSIVNFTNTSTGGVRHIWLFGDGDTSTAQNPTHTYQNQTLFIQNYTAQLVVTSANGCTDTSQRLIVVYPEPIFTFQALPDSGCSPLTTTFPAVTGAVAYKWYFGDGDSATGSTPTHTYINSTTNNVTYTAMLIATSSFGCSDTNYGDIIVHPNPSSQFTVSDSVNCQPHDLNITNMSTGAIKYHWDFGNGDTSDTAAAFFPYTYTHTDPTPKISRLQLVVETQEGCFDTSFKSITTYPQIHADFTMSDSAGCTPLSMSFSNQSTGVQFYAWKFGDGFSSINTSPGHVYYNNGLVDTIYYPELVVTSQYGCQDSLTDTLIIHPKPVSSFTKNNINGCHPFPVNFTNNSTIADTNFWYFGDGDSLFSNQTNISHTYVNQGFGPLTRTITLYVETNNGCRDTSRQTVDVYPEVIAGFVKSDSAGCTPLRVSFADQSSGAFAYLWRFGDGTVSAARFPLHTYFNSGLSDTTFYPELLVTNQWGCQDSIRDTVMVFPQPLSSFTPDQVRGCQPMVVNFQNLSQLNSKSEWDFGTGDTSMINGNVSYQFTHNQTTPKTFQVRLKVESVNGCTDTSFRNIEVYPPVQANFTAPDSAGCTDLTLHFKNSSIGASSYEWNFGDGNTDRIADPINIFVNQDTLDRVFPVRLIATSIYSCSDTVEKNITVYPRPQAGFIPNPIVQKFPAATVNLQYSGSNGPWSFLWEFGDTNTSAAKEPGSHTYGTWGDFTIRQQAFTAFCRDTFEVTVTIEPPQAVVNFNASASGCRPVTLNIENNTLYGKEFLWNFGDGGTSTLENPGPYTYYNPGTYTVSLTVIGFDNGVENVFKSDSVVVHPNAIALFDYRPLEVSVPNIPVLFYNLSQESDSWTWDFGDGNTSTEKNPEYYYQTAGIYTIKLIANNEFGCLDSFSIENAVEAISVGNLVYPTAFTPDPSGPSGGAYDPNTLDNSIFFPIQEGVVEFEMFVFNRWGEMVFTTKDVRQGWDGYYRDSDKMCPQDVYIWKAVGKYANGSNFEEAGEVTLMR